MRKKYLVLLLIPLVFLFAFVSKSRSSEDATKETTDKEGFIGAETCQGCHETQYASYAKTVHSKKHVKGPASQDACETCHGPGAKHVEKGGGRGVDIFAFNKNTDPKARTAKCLACHEEQRQQKFWSMSKHKAEDVSCDDCHSPHRGGDKLLKAEKSEVCFKCHRDIKAMVNKQSHHPIKEGKVSCSDCHNPHGEFGDKMIKADSVNELCYKCHADKRGPFMWEHPPVEENCATCHNPHGSNHNRLLVMRTPQLCQQCHDGAYHPGTPYTQFSSFSPPARGTFPAPQLVGRACLNCHNDVHGTNGPSAYGQRFLK